MYYAYLRVSTDDQALGLAAQESAIRAYYASLGEKAPLGKLFIDEGVSAWKRDLFTRPLGSELIKTLKAGDHLILAYMDRGWRSVQDFSNTIKRFKKLGVTVHFTRPQINMGTANGQLIANFLAAIAEWESSLRSENVRAAKALKRLGGRKSEQNVWEESSVRWSEPSVPESLQGAGTVYSYGRVSHQNSVDSGLGLIDQSNRCDAYSQTLLATGLVRGQHFEDLAVSAYKVPFAEREAGRHLNELLKPGDHVVFARLDRAFRNVSDMRNTVCDGAESWLARGITVHFVDQAIDTSTAYGKIMLTVLTLASEIYVAISSERQKKAKAECRKLGRPRNGEVPLGYRVNSVQRCGKRYKKFVLDLKQLRTIRYIVHLRDRYEMSWAAIAERLENILATRENREPIPISGKFGLDRKTLVYREWGWERCKKAYAAWDQLRGVLDEGKVRSAA